MASRADNSDDSIEFSVDISDGEEESDREQETVRAEHSVGIQPYRFEPECSSSEENSSDHSDREDAEETRRMDDLFWLVFFVKFCCVDFWCSIVKYVIEKTYTNKLVQNCA